MIRTVALLALFAWFTNAGARLGAETLAANHVLMQFVALAAFVLDGFAFTAESRVGHAIGARSRPQLLRAIRLTGEFSLAAGAAFGATDRARRRGGDRLAHHRCRRARTARWRCCPSSRSCR